MATNSIQQQVEIIKNNKHIALMTHVVIGYPTLETTVELVKLMSESGVDFVELQIPFSDPLADGPTIMRACEESLHNGTKVKDAFVVMEQLSQEVKIPLLFMAYFNTVFCYGIESFCRDAAKAGASGLIVPDMPIDEEENEHFYALCKKYHLTPIHVVSPVSTDERLAKNAEMAEGIIYATARQGITGAKNTLDPKLFSFINRLKQHFSIPIAVGFGISSQEQIHSLKEKADIAVIGSVLIDAIGNSNAQNLMNDTATLLQDLRMERNENGA